MRDVVIVSAVRTPVGKFQGALSELSAVELGAIAVRAAVRAAGIDAGSVDECLMGCVLPAEMINKMSFSSAISSSNLAGRL